MGLGKDILNSLSSGLTGGLGSIAGSIGSAVSGGLGQLFKSAQDKREHEYFIKRSDYQQKLQKEIMDKQQQQAIDFWNMQNEYNDPTAVADRYRNAGINPLSAFGGSVVGLGASSAPMPSAGSAYGAGAGGSSLPSLDSPMNVALAGSQISKTELEKENLSITGRLLSEQVISEQLANQIEEVNLRVKRLTADDDVELSHLQVEQKREEIKKTQQEIKESIQRVSESLARENLTNEQRELVTEQIVEQMYQNSLLEIKLKYADKIESATLERITNDAYAALMAGNADSALAKLRDSYRLTDEQEREVRGYYKQAEKEKAIVEEQRNRKHQTAAGQACYEISMFCGALGQLLSGSVYYGANSSSHKSAPTETTTKTRSNTGTVTTTTTTKKNLKKFIKKGK